MKVTERKLSHKELKAEAPYQLPPGFSNRQLAGGKDAASVRTCVRQDDRPRDRRQHKTPFRSADGRSTVAVFSTLSSRPPRGVVREDVNISAEGATLASRQSTK
jgi:hypothetical protein